MSTEGESAPLDAVRDEEGGIRDTVLVLGLMAGIYVLFTVFSVLLGFNFNGIVSTLQRVTFLVAVYALAVLALNLHWGYAGLFNIGVAGFMAVGAYTTAMLAGSPGGDPAGLGLPLFVAILGGMLAAAIVGLVAGLPALRLKADYLAIVTVAISEIIRLTYNSRMFSSFTVFGVSTGTGGAGGFGNVPLSPVRRLLLTNPGSVLSDPTAIGGIVFGLGEALGLGRPTILGVISTGIIVLAVGLVYLFLSRVGNSPYGRVLKAIREDEMVARSLGKDTAMFKLKTFMVGCALMGLAGILWYGSIGTSSIYPTNFRPESTFFIFIALIIGGAGSNTGSVLGAAVFAALLFEAPPDIAAIVEDLLAASGIALPETQNFIDAVAPLASAKIAPLVGYFLANISSLRFIFVGILLIYLVQRRPQGLLGHRKEVAASVDLTEGSRPERAAAADGGEEGDDDE